MAFPAAPFSTLHNALYSFAATWAETGSPESCSCDTWAHKSHICLWDIISKLILLLIVSGLIKGNMLHAVKRKTSMKIKFEDINSSFFFNSNEKVVHQAFIVQFLCWNYFCLKRAPVQLCFSKTFFKTRHFITAFPAALWLDSNIIGNGWSFSCLFSPCLWRLWEYFTFTLDASCYPVENAAFYALLTFPKPALLEDLIAFVMPQSKNSCWFYYIHFVAFRVDLSATW